MIFQNITIKIPVRFICCIYLLFAIATSYAQSIPTSTKKDFIQYSEKSLKDTLDKRTAIEFPYVIGRYHVPINNKYNNPYFRNNEWVKGNLVFKGRYYSVEGIKYDIEDDHLIYLMYSDDYSLNSVALDENFITEFTIQNSTFRYFKGLKNYLGISMDDGYYQVVYDGNLKFLVRWKKSKTLNDVSSSMRFNTTSDMYLLDHNRIKHVNSMAKLKRQLRDRKKDVRAFINHNRLRLNRSDYLSAYDVLNYYESLKK